MHDHDRIKNGSTRSGNGNQIGIDVLLRWHKPTISDHGQQPQKIQQSNEQHIHLVVIQYRIGFLAVRACCNSASTHSKQYPMAYLVLHVPHITNSNFPTTITCASQDESWRTHVHALATTEKVFDRPLIRFDRVLSLGSTCHLEQSTGHSILITRA